MVFEMLNKEKMNYRISSKINAFSICDKVGSGKSIDVLALILSKPYVEDQMPNRLIYKPSKFINFKGFKIDKTDFFFFKTTITFANAISF